MNQRPHILVIEDDVEIRSLLRDYLAREGFRVDVGDGGAALDRTIDVQVSRLRKKIERNGELIKTVRSAGYIFTGTVKEA